MLRQFSTTDEERGSGRISAIALTVLMLAASIAPANASQCRRPGEQSTKPKCVLTTLPG